jgi:predicted amidohydrolase
MNVVCCQLDIIWENKPANHDKVRALIERAAPPRDSLLILPEMFSTGFSMNVAAVSESGARTTEDFLAATAVEYGLYVLGGVVVTTADRRGLNQCVVYSPGGRELARYSKMHPFTYGGETEHYSAGADTVVFGCGEFTVAPFICYDLRFPEVFRAAVRRGATLFTVIANWPAARAAHWTTLLKARAIENQAYVAGVNRCGRDPQLAYPGLSLIVDPRGEVIAEAGSQETTISARLELPALEAYRREFPFLNDINPDYVKAH